ncbi:MAG: GDP-mannose 4,6-dehydratase [Planctomycetota bacterium]
MAQRALVTGAGRFIGSHLVEALVREGYRVSAMVHYNALNGWGNLGHLSRDILDSIEVVETDIREEGHMCVLVRDVDVVFHLAALISIPFSYVAPHQFIEVNVKGTPSLLNACRGSNVSRFVHVSTSEVYGSPRQVRMSEAHPLNPQSPYAASKLMPCHATLTLFRMHDIASWLVVKRTYCMMGLVSSACEW